MWFGLQICPVPTVNNTTSINVWLDYLFEFDVAYGFDNVSLISVALYTLWMIWKAKNLKLFEDKNLNPKEILFVVNSLCYEFMTSKPLPKPRVTSSTLLLGFPCLRDPCVSMLLKSTLMHNLFRAQEKGILILCVEMQMGS